MISEDNICKLGDFGLVADLHKKDYTEGDCRYIAPETLQHNFTKAADIFSLGITILELASKIELPKSGYLWHQLRSGILPDHLIPRKTFSFPAEWKVWNLIVFRNLIFLTNFVHLFSIDLSNDLKNIIKSMMHPRPEQRPNVNALLAVPQIKKILRRRRLLKPFISIVSILNQVRSFVKLNTQFKRLSFTFQRKFSRNLMGRMHTLKIYIVNLFLSLFSFFKLKHLKAPNQAYNIALTSTPTAPTVAIQPTSDDSFLRLDDSEIDFDDSPSNRSINRSQGKPPESLIVNSTPLNHYNSHGSFRRSRMEISRTSLV